MKKPKANGNVCDYCGNLLVITSIYNQGMHKSQYCNTCICCSRTTNGVRKKIFDLAQEYDPSKKDYELSKVVHVIEWAFTKWKELEETHD